MTDKEWEKKWKKAMARLHKAHAGWYAAQREEKAAWENVHALTAQLPEGVSPERADREIAKALKVKI
jgi:ferric-dicitrate binding protein FerR (iron transport regulator)